MRSSLTPGWKNDSASGGAFLEERYMPYGYMKYTSQLATSFVPIALGGWDGAHSARVRDAFAYLEHLCGSAIDTDGDGEADAYLYDTDAHPDASSHGKPTHLRMWATANLALGSTYDAGVTASLYDGSLVQLSLSRPHLISLTPGAPKALVRRAVFGADPADADAGLLRLVLTSAPAAGVKGVRLTIGVPDGWRRANATAATTAAASTFDVVLDVSAKDTPLDLRFERATGSS
jgi:hypothetical protein